MTAISIRAHVNLTGHQTLAILVQGDSTLSEQSLPWLVPLILIVSHLVNSFSAYIDLDTKPIDLILLHFISHALVRDMVLPSHRLTLTTQVNIAHGLGFFGGAQTTRPVIQLVWTRGGDCYLGLGSQIIT